MTEPYGRIYRFYSTESKLVYVGATRKPLERRRKDLLSTTPRSKRWSRPLADEVRHFESKTFRIEELDSAETLHDLREKERHWIDRLGTLWPNGLNLHPGGVGGFVQDPVSKVERDAKYQTWLASLPEKVRGKVIGWEIERQVDRVIGADTPNNVDLP